MPDEVKSVKEVKPLSDTYHKARRMLALFSGILIAWEYAGIKIGTSKIPISETPVTFNNSEVFPVIILMLVFYFTFRVAVEWNQCDEERKDIFAAQADLFVSYLIAGVALTIYAFQQTSTLRLADFLTPFNAVVFVAGGGVSFGFLCLYYVLWPPCGWYYLYDIEVKTRIELRKIITERITRRMRRFYYILSITYLSSLVIAAIIYFVFPAILTLSLSFIIGTTMTIVSFTIIILFNTHRTHKKYMGDMLEFRQKERPIPSEDRRQHKHNY